MDYTFSLEFDDLNSAPYYADKPRAESTSELGSETELVSYGSMATDIDVDVDVDVDVDIEAPTSCNRDLRERPSQPMGGDDNEATTGSAGDLSEELKDRQRGSWGGWYWRALEARPLWTKMGTVGVVCAGGEMLARVLRGDWDCCAAGARGVGLGRVWTKFVIGAVLTAPLYHWLYAALERAFPTGVSCQGGRSGQGQKNRLVHLAVDQLIATPLWIAAYLAMDSFLLHLTSFSPAEFTDRFARDFTPLLFTCWVTYSLVQYLNFTYVPVDARILVLTGVGFVFNTIVSYCFGTVPTPGSTTADAAAAARRRLVQGLL